jgi:hypothetical protein
VCTYCGSLSDPHKTSMSELNSLMCVMLTVQVTDVDVHGAFTPSDKTTENLILKFTVPPYVLKELFCCDSRTLLY